ncbi:hypothetical protein [Achromobacter anxifer]
MPRETLRYRRNRKGRVSQFVDDLPGSVRQPESALVRGQYRGRADHDAGFAGGSGRDAARRRVDELLELVGLSASDSVFRYASAKAELAKNRHFNAAAGWVARANAS